MPATRTQTPNSVTARSVERFFQFSLLGLVASGFFALAGSRRLDTPTFVLTLLALLVRALVVGNLLRVEIPVRIVSAAALVYIGFYPLDFFYFSRDFFAATLHGVCFLAGVRILTAENNRDYLFTGAVAFIELIGAALLSFQASFFGWLALYILFAIAAFTSSEIRRSLARSGHTVPPTSARTDWRLAVVAGAATAGILIVTGGLFLIVPRTARAAALMFPNAPRLTGFSNVVDLGTFGEIGRDTRPVMHIQSYSRALPPNLKWRGAALSRFDGRRWSEPVLVGTSEIPIRNGTAEVASRAQRARRDGRRLLYRVDVNSSDTGTLFIAGIPEYLNITAPRLIRTSEDAFRVLPVTGEELRYEVSALLAPPLPTPLAPAERARYLQLPPIDTRIWDLAREWADSPGAGLPGERAERIRDHLRRDFQYSLETSSRPIRNPLGNFLFVTRRGYCEYFASAMAVMLRSLGIPSRVATGFQSGYYNEVSGLQVVRASDAHAWVEAWIDGRGWVTYDPTPSSREGVSAGLAGRINMYFDALDSMWQQWVMAYDLGHQAVLAARFESLVRRWNATRLRSDGGWLAHVRNDAKSWLTSPVGFLFAAILLLALLAPLLPGLWRTSRRRLGVHRIARRVARGGGSALDASVLYEHLLSILDRRGFPKPAAATPAEFARALPATEREPVARFTDLYNAARFGGNGAATAELAELLRAFQKR